MHRRKCLEKSTVHPPNFLEHLLLFAQTASLRFACLLFAMDINASVALPKHEFRAFGNDEFTAEEMAEIQRQLEEDIPFDHLNFREGPSGSM